MHEAATMQMIDGVHRAFDHEPSFIGRERTSVEHLTEALLHLFADEKRVRVSVNPCLALRGVSQQVGMLEFGGKLHESLPIAGAAIGHEPHFNDAVVRCIRKEHADIAFLSNELLQEVLAVDDRPQQVRPFEGHLPQCKSLALRLAKV